MSLLRNLSFPEPREELTEIGFVDSICYVPRKRKIPFCRVALLLGFSAWICTVLCRIVVSAVDMTSFRQKTVRFQIPVFRLESYIFLPNPTQELAGARKNSAKSCRIPGKTPVSGIVQFFAESGKSSTISGARGTITQTTRK